MHISSDEVDIHRPRCLFNIKYVNYEYVCIFFTLFFQENFLRNDFLFVLFYFNA